MKVKTYLKSLHLPVAKALKSHLSGPEHKYIGQLILLLLQIITREIAQNNSKSK